MRQAGRSLPEYHKVREGIPMLESCTRPELVTEITLQPLRRYDVDAAILFSDIVVPLRAVGVDVDIKAGIGPVVDRPFREAADVQRLRPLKAGDVPYIAEAVRLLVAELGDKFPTVSQRLRILRSEGLVARRRQGTHLFYALADRHVADLIHNALAHADELETAPAPEDGSPEKGG